MNRTKIEEMLKELSRYRYNIEENDGRYIFDYFGTVVFYSDVQNLLTSLLHSEDGEVRHKSLAEHIVDAIWVELSDRSITNGIDTATEQEIIDCLVEIANKELNFYNGHTAPVKDEVKESLIDKILKRSSLETRLKVILQMNDTEHWKDGEYTGIAHNILPQLLNAIEKWQIDTAPSKGEAR